VGKDDWLIATSCRLLLTDCTTFVPTLLHNILTFSYFFCRYHRSKSILLSRSVLCVTSQNPSSSFLKLSLESSLLLFPSIVLRPLSHSIVIVSILRRFQSPSYPVLVGVVISSLLCIRSSSIPIVVSSP